jgi:hypothetical protein
MKLRRLAVSATVAAVAATSLAACGSSEEPSIGKDEGTYVNTGDLAYQVQISRQLNASDFEDRDYLTGLPTGAGKLAVGQEWFAVFLRVFNRSDRPEQSASQFTITDTTGKTYQPIIVDPNLNRTAYHAAVVKGGDQIPVPGSLARENLTQGGVILFKVQSSSYASRPLVLKITPPNGGPAAQVKLDV